MVGRRDPALRLLCDAKSGKWVQFRRRGRRGARDGTWGEPGADDACFRCGSHGSYIPAAAAAITRICEDVLRSCGPPSFMKTVALSQGLQSRSESGARSGDATRHSNHPPQIGFRWISSSNDTSVRSYGDPVRSLGLWPFWPPEEPVKQSKERN